MTKRPAGAGDRDDQEVNLSRELQVAFGENVRSQRMKLGLKQSDLSIRCGIDQSVISKIERGEFNLTIKQMTRLAKALDGEVTSMLKPQMDNQ
jgi:ribosome-binding protein aMBF1 (putative translation factor)